MTTGTMKTMDQSGDTEIKWDRSDPDSIAIAREAFNEATQRRSEGGKGYLAYRVERGGKGAVIRDFDPAAERIILAPPMAGG
jgi:hypothetical protein